MDDVFSIQDPHFWALSRYMTPHMFKDYISNLLSAFKNLYALKRQNMELLRQDACTELQKFRPICCLPIYKMGYFVDMLVIT